MALFTRLFPRRLKTTERNWSHEDTTSEKLCQFDTKQVRLVLFRECDFRGRKLLFDSDATRKVPVEKKGENENFVEVSDGLGYLISKQNSDYGKLSEMIFGSVAMSFRGTYFKIHSLTEPFRLMFTQVFPSPHMPRRRISSSSHQSSRSARSFDHSVVRNDSGGSSAYSSEPQLSDKSTRSTASDTVLVWKGRHTSSRSFPRSSGVLSKNSLVIDSAFGDNHSSFSSVSSGPLKFDTWESVVSCQGTSNVSFSSFTHLKHLLRRSSRSLQSSSCSLPNSTDDVIPRGHHSSSKLGLAIVLDIPEDKQEFLTQFLMEHIVLIESTLWRARLAIETAYHRPPSFISAMFNLSSSIAQWLVDLLSVPRQFSNLWHCLSLKSCDKNLISINSELSEINKVNDAKNFGGCGTGSSNYLSENNRTNSDPFDDSINKTKNVQDLKIEISVCLSDNNIKPNGKVINRTSSCNLIKSNYNNKPSLTSSVSFSKIEKTDFFSGFSLGKFLKTDLDSNSALKSDSGHDAEEFLKEFCEVLAAVDVKDTNFFISTLLTAVLTHHLGWVATCLPTNPQTSNSVKTPYNSLWSQLTDLYGAVGYPVKTAQTVITGSNRNNIINKILNGLTYFIRCSDVERKTVERGDIRLENKEAESILTEAQCIPKESYKKYEEHVKELLVPSCSYAKEDLDIKWGPAEELKALNEVKIDEDLKVNSTKRMEKNSVKGLPKVKTYTNLSKFHSEVKKQTIPDDISTNDCIFATVKVQEKETKNGVNLIENPKPLSKVSTYSGNLTDLGNIKTFKKDSTHNGSLQDLLHFKADNKAKFGLDHNDNVTETKSGSSVIFVLGEDDKLVNIKKLEAFTEKFNKFDFIHPRENVGIKRRNSLHNIYVTKLPNTNLEHSRLRKTSVTTVLDAKLNAETVTNKNLTKRPTSLNPSKSNSAFFKTHKVVDPFREEFYSNTRLKPSSSYESLSTTTKDMNEKPSSKEDMDIKEFSRCQSEPPESRPPKTQFKYSRVKFNLQQYPQVVRNYMKSKNLELENLPFEDKIGDQFSIVENNVKLDFSGYDTDQDFSEVLQTPSNASELEGTSELGQEDWGKSNSATSVKERPPEVSKNVWVNEETECSSKEKLSEFADKLTILNLKTGWITEDIIQNDKDIQKDVMASRDFSEKECYNFNNAHILKDHDIEKTLNVSKKLEETKLKRVKNSIVLSRVDFKEKNQEDNSLESSNFLRRFSKENLPGVKQKKEHSETKSVKSSWILGRGNSIEQNENNGQLCISNDLVKEVREKDCKNDIKLVTEATKESAKPMRIVMLPMPKTVLVKDPHPYSLPYTSTVIKGMVDTYVPDMVLQGTTSPEKSWDSELKRNLMINAQHSLLDQPVEESLAIVANTDTWEVQLISSHTYVIDKNSSGVRVGMSQLVSNMLESLLQMWKSNIPSKYCLIHIEQKLQELCTLSKALAQLLLASEFCSMEVLTSTLHLEVNDVPLLMAVASTHTPQVTEKYGLSFQ